MTRTLVVSSALLLVVLSAVAEESKPTVTPKLEIVTRLGAKEEVKVYNRESVLFFTRAAGGDGSLLRGVKFVLYDEGGVPDRKEFIRSQTEDRVRWGRPPSRFALPLLDRPLPIGRYRLRATKRGHISHEIKIICVGFTYFDLVVDHDEDHYAAKFHIRLADRTEKRRIIPVEVQIETGDGLLVDAQSVNLRQVAGRDVVLETVDPIRISSRVTAHRARTEERRPIVLKVVPHARLVLVIDGIRFAFPVPLPTHQTRSRDEPDRPSFGDRRGGGRGR